MEDRASHQNVRGDCESQRLSITLFFPCYNEQANIGRVVKEALQLVETLKADHEVIIVDDGSSDDTGRLADELAANNEHVRVIHHPQNLGYGAALQSGFRAAVKELVFYTDGDGQFDINELPQLLPLAERYDVVSCYRLKRQDSFVRKFNAWCWTKLVCLMFNMNLRDIDCAFKLFRRRILDDIEMRSTGALIDAEILARLVRKGCAVVQRPVRHYPRVHGEQTGAKLSVILRAFRELFMLRRSIVARQPTEDRPASR